MLDIIEYAGPEGMRIPATDPNRINTPRSGDSVIIAPNHPLNWTHLSAEYCVGRIGDIGPHRRLANPTDVEIAVIGGCYLSEGERNQDGSYEAGECLISGGPFITTDQSMLEPTGQIVEAQFWNFGGRTAGPDTATYFSLPRPVFRLAYPPQNDTSK